MTTWKPAFGFEGRYEVSDLGEVRNAKTGLVLSKIWDRKGYAYYHLYRGHDVRETWKAHRLVAATFIGFQEGLLVRHLDGNPANNSVGNLAWGTEQDNTNDRIAHGRKSGYRRDLLPHCKHGHEYTEANTYMKLDHKTGRRYRRCRACARAEAERLKAKRH